MLQIRLSKGAPGSEGGTGTPKLSGSENVTVSCPDHLVLADLPVAKGLASPSNLNLSVKAVKTVGRKRRRRQGDKVHICVSCDFPIAIYGRLSPCEHAFCLMCARSEPSCYLCDERIQKIQTIKMLDGIFICGAPHCLRSFLKKYDFEQHLKDVHLDLLLPESEKEAQQKDVSTAKPSVSDTQYKQPLHVESQALSRSVSAPSLHPSQQVPHAAESSSLPSQPNSVSMSPVTSPPEKQPQLNQSTGFIGTPVTSPPEKQLQLNQSIGPSSAANFQEQQKSEQKQSGYQQQFDHQGNTGANPLQQNQVMTQVSEKQPNQSPQHYYHRHLHGERHHTNSEMYQSPRSGQQYSQQQEKQQMDGLYQHNPAYQVLPQRPPMLVSANQPGIPPPFPTYPFPLSYPLQPEVQPQQSTPHFDPTISGPPVDDVAVQASMQNVQENNQRLPMQSPFIPQMQDSCQITQHAGSTILPNEGTSVISGPQEVYMHANGPGPFSHFQSDLGQVPAGMAMQLLPQGMGMVYDQSSHFQDPTHGPEMPPPLQKHRTYQNMPVHMDAAANYGWGGGRPNFGGHGYGSWSGPS